MHFLVLGVDGPEFDGELEAELPEEHQRYMDGWADVLVARGPVLSNDGERHAGSVHVVDLPDLAAHRFADEEPFAQVTVEPLARHEGGAGRRASKPGDRQGGPRLSPRPASQAWSTSLPLRQRAA